MKKITIAACFLVAFSVSGELYSPGARLDDFLTGTNYAIGSVITPAGKGGGAVWLDVDIQDPSVGILKVNETFGGSFGAYKWFEVSVDTEIDDHFVSSTTPFYSAYDPANFPTGISMFNNVSFYMAFWEDSDDPSYGFPGNDVYGWAELMWDGAGLHLLDSAAENDGVGIIAGRYEQVPEPSSVLLLAFGSGGILFYRRAKRRRFGAPY